MHKTVNHIVRGLVEGHSDDWERRIPFRESLLRMVPLAALGGRSPYEVVTGLKPRMPAALTPGHPVQYLEINEYVGRLQQYFQETYAEIQVIQRERAEAQEPRGEGRELARKEISC